MPRAERGLSSDESNYESTARGRRYQFELVKQAEMALDVAVFSH